MKNEELLSAISGMLDQRLAKTEASLLATMDQRLAQTEATLLATMDQRIAQSEATLLATMDQRIAQSENLVLSEVSRTHEIMLQRTDALKEDLQDVKRSIAVIKANDEMMSILLDRVDAQDKRLDKVDKLEKDVEKLYTLVGIRKADAS